MNTATLTTARRAARQARKERVEAAIARFNDLYRDRVRQFARDTRPLFQACKDDCWGPVELRDARKLDDLRRLVADFTRDIGVIVKDRALAARRLGGLQGFAVAGVIDKVQERVTARESDSYFKDCPRVPAGSTDGHPGACAPSGGGKVAEATAAMEAWEKARDERPDLGNYKTRSSEELLQINQRLHTAVKLHTNGDQEMLAKFKALLAANREEIASRREFYALERRRIAAEEFERTGILTITSDEAAELLGKPGDTYRDASMRPDEWGRFEYTPETFRVSDLSGKLIRHYIQLPDGRVAHPDEINDARKRGRIVVVDDIKVPARDWTKKLTESSRRESTHADTPRTTDFVLAESSPGLPIANLSIGKRPSSRVVIPEQGKVWAVQPKNEPVWVLPGGGVDPGEEFADAAVREALEEIGFAVEIEDSLFDVEEPGRCGACVALVNMKYLEPDHPGCHRRYFHATRTGQEPKPTIGDTEEIALVDLVLPSELKDPHDRVAAEMVVRKLEERVVPEAVRVGDTIPCRAATPKAEPPALAPGTPDRKERDAWRTPDDME